MLSSDGPKPKRQKIGETSADFEYNTFSNNIIEMKNLFLLLLLLLIWMLLKQVIPRILQRKVTQVIARKRGASGGTNFNGSHAATWINSSKLCKSSIVSFSKSRILINYGFSTENIQTAHTIDQISTSMGLIPVDLSKQSLSNTFISIVFKNKKYIYISIRILQIFINCIEVLNSKVL